MIAIEKETNINFNNKEIMAVVFTCKKSLINKLDKYCIDYPEDYIRILETNLSSTYVVNKKLIIFKRPRKKKFYTLDEKKALLNRFKKSILDIISSYF